MFYDETPPKNELEKSKSKDYVKKKKKKNSKKTSNKPKKNK